MAKAAVNALLLCIIALAMALPAFATPVTVHYTVFSMQGSQLATGDVGDGSKTWVNDPTLADGQNSTNRMVEFWIDPQIGTPNVQWSFTWGLAYGGNFSATGDTRINRLSILDWISIGTTRTSPSSVGGDLIASDQFGTSLAHPVTLKKDASYSLGSAASAANEKTGSTTWSGDGVTSVWAYLGNRTTVSSAGNLISHVDNFANVVASADVSTPIPLFLPGGQGADQAVPEPASGFLAAIGLCLLTRRRCRWPI